MIENLQTFIDKRKLIDPAQVQTGIINTDHSKDGIWGSELIGMYNVTRKFRGKHVTEQKGNTSIVTCIHSKITIYTCTDNACKDLKEGRLSYIQCFGNKNTVFSEFSHYLKTKFLEILKYLVLYNIYNAYIVS